MSLEITKITPYLPYVLKIMVDDVICEIEGVDLHFPDTIIAERVNYKLSNIKPILRPLSDLTKEIEHNGEKFIPIIELAKIQNPTLDNFEVSETNLSVFSTWDDQCHYGTYTFSYNESRQSFFLEEGKRHLYLSNHLILIQKLFEWHFDVFGLIKNKEALDINTFKIN